VAIKSDILDKAKIAAAHVDSDVFFYNGPLQTTNDLECIRRIKSGHHRETATIFLTTNGGDPDSAYKIARYLQEIYKSFHIVISGRCKSAGTLLAIGATGLIFAPYGELGPLDIQLSKVDKFDHMESGLTIQDSLNTLEGRAISQYFKMVQTYIRANNGLLSFASATDAASKLISALYGPIFARVDPEEVGARARSMRIAVDYGKRLSAWSGNLKDSETLQTLAETYPSHSFVIDQQEASLLFQRVRAANDAELAVIDALGAYARFEHPSSSDCHFYALSERHESAGKDAPNGSKSSRRSASNGGDSARAKSASPVRRQQRKSRVSRAVGIPGGGRSATEA
jgi:hypothetical protein